MKSNLLKQTLYEMRHQPVAASVTLIGTAFAIFLMMTVMMIDSVRTVPIPPESRRADYLFGFNFHTQSTGSDDYNDRSARLNYKLARHIYGNLEGIDTLTYYYDDLERVDVSQAGRPTYMLNQRFVDEGFWAVFDHKLLAGRTFDSAQVDGKAKVVVLSESAARNVTGADAEGAVGQTVQVGKVPYRIIGVVADNTAFATHAYGEIFSTISKDRNWDEFFGPVSVAMLKTKGYPQEKVKQQVMDRYEQLNGELAAQNLKAVYHEQPYDQRLAGEPMGSNTTPSSEESDRKQVILIILLVLVPAINMSAMTQSRLNRRMAETGVKRAYGATRGRIMLDILLENMIVTIIGGAIGLVLSMVGAWLLSDTFFAQYTDAGSVSVPWQVLFDWHIFALALGGCFVLNLLSAGIPAWRASRVSPVDALRS